MTRFESAVATLTALVVLVPAYIPLHAGQPNVIDIEVTTGNPPANSPSGPPRGAAIPVENPSFEEQVLLENNYTHSPCLGAQNCVETPTRVIGWTVDGVAGTWNPTPAGYPEGASDGSNVAFGNPGPSTISQVLGATAKADTLYTLEVDVGTRTTYTFKSYTVQLWAGDTLVAQDVNGLQPTPGSFETSRIQALVEAGPAVGEALEIVLISDGGQTNFDNVRLTAGIAANPSTVTFYFMMNDGDPETAIARNGTLTLGMECSSSSGNSTAELFLVDSAAGAASAETGDLAANTRITAASATAETQSLTETSNASMAAQEGSYITVDASVMVNFRDHDCVAIGTAVLIADPF